MPAKFFIAFKTDFGLNSTKKPTCSRDLAPSNTHCRVCKCSRQSVGFASDKGGSGSAKGDEKGHCASVA